MTDTQPDLFGKEGRLPGASLRPPADPHAADLFTAAAEARALSTGCALSQARADIFASNNAAKDERA